MDTVEIVDPAHPLYGKKLPLVGFGAKQHLGRVAIVWLDPGVERYVPVSATDLAEMPPAPPSPSRLSVGSLERLLAVVASLPYSDLEDADDDARTSRSTHPAAESGATAAADAALRTERTTEEQRRADRTGDGPVRGVGGSSCGDEDGGPSGLPAHDAGGGR